MFSFAVSAITDCHILFYRVAAFQSSFLKSPTLQLTSSQRLPVTKTPVMSSNTSLYPSPVTSTTPSPSRQQPVASLHIDPYHLVDVEVQLKPSCHDIMLQGRVGVVTKISGRTATVQIRDNSSDVTIPHDSLMPVPVRPSDTVKVIGGSDSILGFVGTLVSKIGSDGVVQFVSTRRRNPAQVPLSQLGRYSPKSKFPLGLPLSVIPSKASSPVPNTSSGLNRASVASNNLGVLNRSVATFGGTSASPVMCLYAVPTQEQRDSSGMLRSPTRSSNPFFATSAANFPTTSAMVSMPRPCSSNSTTAFLSHARNSAVLFGGLVERDGPDSRERTERDSARPRTFVVTNPSTRYVFSQKAPDFSTARQGTTLVASQRRAVDRPTGQLVPFPVNPLSMKIPTPSQGLFFLGPGGVAKVVARGGGADVRSNGYSVSEVLERLVENQRSYTYELTSPSTPGGCGL